MEVLIAFGVLAVAILGMMAAFIAGVRASAQSERVASGTELARQTLERIRSNVQLNGSGYLPPGSYAFDGRLPSAQVGSPPLQFPPAPYPGSNLNGQDIKLVITGQDISPKLRYLRVESYWGESGHAVLETHLHL